MTKIFNHVFKCQQCGECCSKYCIPITHTDLYRILRHLGKEINIENISEIVEFIEPDDEVLDTYDDVPKILLSNYANDNLVMVIQGEDYCQFFDGVGCSIYPVRPLVCRFFPFTYEFVDDDEDYSNPESKEVVFELNPDTDYCKGKTEGKLFDFEKLKQEVYNTTREDVKFEKVVSAWNVSVIFNQREDYHEEAFYEYLINLKD
ncbi:MAG: hypothetical protein EAX96_09245 [Candidatus Lokiarchaeota archaeon]|nr:hypothetical protein [Candidatus Lokiarchaeota archaeon]